MFKRQVLLECISALLILLFLYASLSKFMDFSRFIKEINNQPLPNSWTPFLVRFVPSSEILICLLVLFERTRQIGFWISAAMMLAFTIYATIILMRGFAFIPCSCGGVIRNLTWPQHLVLNIVYLGLSVTGIILQRKKIFKPIIITKNSLV